MFSILIFTHSFCKKYILPLQIFSQTEYFQNALNYKHQFQSLKCVCGQYILHYLSVDCTCRLMNLLIYWGYKKIRIPLSSFLQTCSSINIFNIKQTWYFLYINPKEISGNADKYDIRRKILKLKKIKKHGTIYKLDTLQKMRTNSCKRQILIQKLIQNDFWE